MESQGQILFKEFEFSGHKHINIFSHSPSSDLGQEIEAELINLSKVGEKPVVIIDFYNWELQLGTPCPVEAQAQSATDLISSAIQILNVIKRNCNARPILLSLRFGEREGLIERLRSLSDDFGDAIIEMTVNNTGAFAAGNPQLAQDEIRLLNRRIRSKFAISTLSLANLRDFQSAKRETLKFLVDRSDDLQVRDSFTCGDLTQHFCYQRGEIRHDKPPRLTIFFNGAIDTSIAKGRPVFQRTSWWNEIHGSKISIPDPTLSKDETLTTGWAQGSDKHWGTAIQAGVSQGVIEFWRKSEGLGSEEGEVQMYGTSAGGFQALMAGAFVDPQRVIVNNAQFDWLKAEGRSAVKKTLDLAYSNRIPGSSIRENWHWRVLVSEFYSRVRFAPPIDYYLNLSSKIDRTVQWPALEKFMFSSQGSKYGGGFNLFAYKDPIRGHNPLGKELTIQILNSSIRHLP